MLYGFRESAEPRSIVALASTDRSAAAVERLKDMTKMNVLIKGLESGEPPATCTR